VHRSGRRLARWPESRKVDEHSWATAQVRAVNAIISASSSEAGASGSRRWARFLSIPCRLRMTATGTSLPVQGEGQASTSSRKQCKINCAQGTYEVDGRHERGCAGAGALGVGAGVCGAAAIVDGSTFFERSGLRVRAVVGEACSRRSSLGGLVGFAAEACAPRAFVVTGLWGTTRERHGEAGASTPW
jgi:hypothetical protein